MWLFTLEILPDPPASMEIGSLRKFVPQVLLSPLYVRKVEYNKMTIFLT